MKKLVFVTISLLCSLYLFSQNYEADQSIKSYRQAIIAYDSMDYGSALKYSEDAILYRKQYIESQISALKKSLSAKRVQVAGDNIQSILQILEQRNEDACINIINYYLKIKGIDYFENSMQKLLKYLEESMVYPEAHKLIADIYKLEGEYDFAENYYQLALKNSDVLDIPAEKYDILYMLAEISRLKNDYQTMEVRLLNILVEDKAFMDKALNNAMIHTITSNKRNSMEKFFNLYRANSYLSIDAYNQLAEYYYKNNNIDKAINFAALSTITSFTKINDIISSRNSEYEYKSLSTFFQEAAFYEDIVKWGNDTKAWSSFNILAKYSKEAGYSYFAKDLLKVLVQFSPEKYWQKDAVLLLEDMD